MGNARPPFAPGAGGVAGRIATIDPGSEEKTPMEAEQPESNRQSARRSAASRHAICGGIFDFDVKASRFEEVSRELEDPKVWETPERAQELGREKKQLEGVVDTLTELRSELEDSDRAVRAGARRGG